MGEREREVRLERRRQRWQSRTWSLAVSQAALTALNSTDELVQPAGEGFVGHRMVELLLERFPDATVSSLDLVQRHFPDKLAAATSRKWSFYSADLTSLDSLSSAFRQAGATCVFHTASPWTGSGADVCEKVNVQGTQAVVDACVKEGVKKLVFTSSAGTVYDGVDLINVDERMPFPEKPIDPYNATKVRPTRFREPSPLKPRSAGQGGADCPRGEREERAVDGGAATSGHLWVSVRDSRSG